MHLMFMMCFGDDFLLAEVDISYNLTTDYAILRIDGTIGEIKRTTIIIIASNLIALLSLSIINYKESCSL